MGGVCSRSTGSMEANPRKQLLMGKEWLLLNLRLACHAILSSDWKNERPRNNNAYVPTQKEHFANIVTHGVRSPGHALLLAQLPDVQQCHWSHPDLCSNSVWSCAHWSLHSFYCLPYGSSCEQGRDLERSSSPQ